MNCYLVGICSGMRWLTECNELSDKVAMRFSAPYFGMKVNKMIWSCDVIAGNLFDLEILILYIIYGELSPPKELVNTSEAIKFIQNIKLGRYPFLTTNYINSNTFEFLVPYFTLKQKKLSSLNDHFSRIYTVFVLYIIIIRFWSFLICIRIKSYSEIRMKIGGSISSLEIVSTTRIHRTLNTEISDQMSE